MNTRLPACAAALCTANTCCFVFRAALGQVEPCSNLVGGRGSPIAPQLSVPVGSSANRAGASWNVPSWPPCPGRGDCGACPKGRVAQAAQGLCSTRLFGPRSAGKEQPPAFCLTRVCCPGTTWQSTLACTSVAAASPACCQGGWISLSNQQEAV